MSRMGRLICMLCVLASGTALMGVAADPQKNLEDTLHRFYEAYVQSQWKTASQYVDPESRDVFLAQPKPGILKYKIQNIEMQNGGKEALVTVGVDQLVQQIGQVMTMNAQTKWRISNGKWRLVIMSPPPIPLTMANVRPTSDNPTPDLRFDYREFDFGQKRQGDLIQIEFPFTNATDHPVRVSASLVSNCNCIKVGVTKETVAPGEKASVQFSLDSQPFSFYYHQGIGVKVEPGGRSAILDITGFLLPAADNPPVAGK